MEVNLYNFRWGILLTAQKHQKCQKKTSIGKNGIYFSTRKKKNRKNGIQAYVGFEEKIFKEKEVRQWSDNRERLDVPTLDSEVQTCFLEVEI